jgi:hypothetical protein
MLISSKCFCIDIYMMKNNICSIHYQLLYKDMFVSDHASHN